MDKNDLLPCPKCNGTNLLFDKCVGTVRCIKCLTKNNDSTLFIRQGYSKQDAGIMAWNSMERSNGKNGK